MPRKQRNQRVLDYVPDTAGCWQIQMTLNTEAHEAQMILSEEEQKENLQTICHSSTGPNME